MGIAGSKSSDGENRWLGRGSEDKYRSEKRLK